MGEGDLQVTGILMVIEWELCGVLLCFGMCVIELVMFLMDVDELVFWPLGAFKYLIRRSI